MGSYWDNAAFGTTSPAETAEKPLSMWDNLFSNTMNSIATLPKRAIDASAADMSNLGSGQPKQSVAPATDIALWMLGGSGAVPAEANTLRSGLKGLPSSSSLAIPPSPTAEAMSRSARVENVDLANVRGTQPKMEWDKYNKGDYPPALIKGYQDRPVAVRREDGEYLIFDGHHRASQALADGKKNMEMHVIDAKDYAPELAGRKPAVIDTDELLRKLFE